MLVFSLVFYSWAGPKYLVLLVGMTFICWIGAMLVEKYRGKSKKVWKYKTKRKKVTVKDYWARDDYVYDLGVF